MTGEVIDLGELRQPPEPEEPIVGFAVSVIVQFIGPDQQIVADERGEFGVSGDEAQLAALANATQAGSASVVNRCIGAVLEQVGYDPRNMP